MPANEEAVAEKRQQRSRARRLNLMLVLVLAAAAFGVFTVAMPWYEMHLPATALRDTNMTDVQGVTAGGSVTGWDLTHQAPAETIPSLGQPTLQPPRPSSVLGLPQPVFFLVALAAFTAVGVIVRIGFVSGIGVVCGFFAWKQFGAFRGILENPNFGGALNHPAEGLMFFQLSLLVTTLLALTVTIQIVMVNAERRRKEKEEATKNGEELTPSFIEVLWGNNVMGPLLRNSGMSGRAQKAKDEAETGHLRKERTDV